MFCPASYSELKDQRANSEQPGVAHHHQSRVNSANLLRPWTPSHTLLPFSVPKVVFPIKNHEEYLCFLDTKVIHMSGATNNSSARDKLYWDHIG